MLHSYNVVDVLLPSLAIAIPRLTPCLHCLLYHVVWHGMNVHVIQSTQGIDSTHVYIAV